MNILKDLSQTILNINSISEGDYVYIIPIKMGGPVQEVYKGSHGNNILAFENLTGEGLLYKDEECLKLVSKEIAFSLIDFVKRHVDKSHVAEWEANQELEDEDDDLPF